MSRKIPCAFPVVTFGFALNLDLDFAGRYGSGAVGAAGAG
jgi:hypothetical protein